MKLRNTSGITVGEPVERLSMKDLLSPLKFENPKDYFGNRI